MSCQHAEDVCQHCLEKVQTKTEYSPPKDTLKKVKFQTKTEYSPPKVQTKTEYSPPKDTLKKVKFQTKTEYSPPKVQTKTEYSPLITEDLPMSWRLKRILLPIVSSVVAVSGVLWVINTKILYRATKAAVEIIVAPTE